MPLGLLVTVPLPVVDTVSVKACVKVAPTERPWVIVTVQGPVPLQAPLQPENVYPEAGVAFRVTCVFDG